MLNGLVDNRKAECSRQTRILWKVFVALLMMAAALMLLAMPQSPLSVPYYMGAGIAAVFCAIFLVLYALSVIEDDRRQFGTDPN